MCVCVVCVNSCMLGEYFTTDVKFASSSVVRERKFGKHWVYSLASELWLVFDKLEDPV